MHRRELIMAEIQRLAEVLSKIMGLKLEGKTDEASRLFDQTIVSNFSLPVEVLEADGADAFDEWLKGNEMPPEKLDSLSEFLYYELGLSAERNSVIAPKLNLVYQYLSAHHKIVHLVNFHRQQTIQQYL
ncbi:hypothetical protein [Pedobacter frigidisoli]|uniref:hypothetical protein n=1 Tax=Pedobacter frigidisoli TaxID=2530455 RepID=UPI00292D3711|nr:hypothetical protein [Pedobacter frigidisoli]